MTKRKSTKGQTTMYKTLSIKLKIEHNTDPTKLSVNSGVRASSACSTSGTSHVTLVTNQVISHERGKDRYALTTSGA